MTPTDPRVLDRSEVTITYRSKSLPCPDCSHSFDFTVAEQALCHELGYEQPVRCRACRRARTAARRTSHGAGRLQSRRTRPLVSRERDPLASASGQRS
ncbi:MAG TPA: zinc-ribbon domain containing protein [Dehalococcoidia bacterium]